MGGQDGFFLEIKFDDPNRASGIVDHELQDKVMSAQCPYGNVTIQFDHDGQLASIDLN